METVFLSFSFRDEDRELVKLVEGMIESHGLRPVTGDSKIRASGFGTKSDWRRTPTSR